MRRVPGVYVLSMEPRSWELTGASFIWGAGQHRIRGCLLCAPIPRKGLGGRLTGAGRHCRGRGSRGEWE